MHILQPALCGGDGGDSAITYSLRHVASAAGSHQPGTAYGQFQLGTAVCVDGASWATVAGWCQIVYTDDMIIDSDDIIIIGVSMTLVTICDCVYGIWGGGMYSVDVS